MISQSGLTQFLPETEQFGLQRSVVLVGAADLRYDNEIQVPGFMPVESKGFSSLTLYPISLNCFAANLFRNCQPYPGVLKFIWSAMNAEKAAVNRFAMFKNNAKLFTI